MNGFFDNLRNADGAILIEFVFPRLISVGQDGGVGVGRLLAPVLV